MNHVDKEIIGDVLSLPIAKRIELVELLLASLDAPDRNIYHLWAAEAESRIDAFDKDQSKSVSLEKVLSKYK